MLDEILLEKLANWRPDTANPTLDVIDTPGNWRVTVEPQAVDRIGADLHRLTVRPVNAVPRGSLRDQAERLAHQVTGLLEPLRLVEIDEPLAVAQLRSVSPAPHANGVRYYEVERHADGTTHLGRFETHPGEGKRQSIPFSLTQEALGKIVRDFTS